MSVTVTVSVTPSLSLTRTNTAVTGETSTLSVTRPSNTRGTSATAVVLTCAKAGSSGSIGLSASTPLNVDVTNLGGVSNWQGDTAFSTDVKLIDVTNNEAIGSGHKLTVFGLGTASALLGPVPTNTDKIVIDPGCRRQLYTQETAGWAVGTATTIKFDPGGNAVNFSLAIAGD